MVRRRNLCVDRLNFAGGARRFVRRSGGQYVFARRAIGPYAGFIVGWSDLLSTCGTNAAVPILIGQYLAKILPALKGYEPVTAIAIVLGFAALQWRSVHRGSRAQEITSLLKGFVYLAIVAACFLLGGGHRESMAASGAAAPNVTIAVAIMLSL